MSAINDLIQKIPDPVLRERIQQEVDKIAKQKKFGLVFEEHLPECTPLYDIPVKKGASVALKTGKITDIYLVEKIKNGIASCIKKDNPNEKAEFNKNDLVCAAEFGEPIYPYLKPIDSVCNAPESDLWHTLIEADNYHALQLLEYLYAGKVDCIYIDPPYNTGARDWKYNNDYVDNSDQYRHSKWLSMMEKRLKLAKKLLNPKDSVLIVTIDEKEYLHLGCLLEELFPEARMQMVSSVINSAGVSRGDEFSRSNEFIFYVKIGDAAPFALPLSDEWRGNIKSKKKEKLVWNQLMRAGTNARRIDRPNLFYPLFVSEDGLRIVKVGAPIPLGQDRRSVEPIPGTRVIWPIRSNGEEGNWQIEPARLRSIYSNGYIRLGSFTDKGMALTYLKSGEQSKVENGVFSITGHRPDGSIIEGEMERERSYIPGTQWDIPSHNATYFGSQLLNKIIGNRFTFPKSLYAEHDTIRFFVANKPNALIVDFFAGSGTTLHAVNLLNAEDGGHRRCIMVTNNEVSDAEAKSLAKQGYKPGDEEWEKLGIARYVTWPRTVCSIKGTDINGNPLKGNYLGSGKIPKQVRDDKNGNADNNGHAELVSASETTKQLRNGKNGDADSNSHAELVSASETTKQLRSDSPIPMSEGFAANAAYFKLGFLDKNSVALGKQFRELLPVLWMKAGCVGFCPSLTNGDLPEMLIFYENNFAVLLDETHFPAFKKELNKHTEITAVFIITDSENGYKEMISELRVKNTYQLYRDYLDNFRINIKK